MKTFIPLMLTAVCTMQSFAQSPVTEIEYAPGSFAKSYAEQTMTNTSDMKAALDQLLTKADTQIQKLEDQLVRMGSYTASNTSRVTGAQTAMSSTETTFDGTPTGDGKITVKSNAVLTAERAAITGDKVFTDSADGIVQGIGGNYTYKVRETTKDEATGKVTSKFVDKTVDRDPARYEQEAKRAFDLTDYYKVRDEALAKQQQLEAARATALSDLLETDDQVETQRLAVLIGSMDAELIACRQDVQNKSDELAMHEKVLSLQQALDTKAKGERPESKGSSFAKLQELIDNANTKRETGKASKERFPFGDRFKKEGEE